MACRTRVHDLELPSRDDRPLWDVMLSWNHFPTLMVADELGLFPLLEATPQAEDAIRAELAIGPRACEAMLSVLTSLGFVARRGGTFHLTELSRNYLLPESPYYWGGMLALLRDYPMNGSTLREAMQEDRQQSLFGPDAEKGLTEEWQGGGLGPEEARRFTNAMHSHSFPAAMGVARWGDFDGVTRMLDVAGGSACFCIALAMRYPEMAFTVMELPAVCEIAAEYIAQYGLQNRVDTRGMDMFRESWPTGYDAMFFSNVFHDWGPQAREHLVREAYDKLPRGGRIYVHEMLLGDTKEGPAAAAGFSINMVLFADGKQFTAAELEHLLARGGFEDVEMLPTYGYYWLVSARKP